MITPNFKVEQDDNFIIIHMTIKYVKVSNVEFHIEKNNFRFYLKPYYINLYFSDNLDAESQNNITKYSVDESALEIKIEKEEKGKFFQNLDLISTLFEKDKP